MYPFFFKQFEEWLKEKNLWTYRKYFQKNGFTSLERLKYLVDIQKVSSSRLRVACGMDESEEWNVFWEALKQTE